MSSEHQMQSSKNHFNLRYCFSKKGARKKRKKEEKLLGKTLLSFLATWKI